KSWRRSECATITARQPPSTSIRSHISPVNAPSLDPQTFCAAVPLIEPFPASTHAAIAVNGGATTISQRFAAATRGLNAAKKSRASCCVLYIFQFPAITGLRMWDTSPAIQEALSVSASTPGSFLPAKNSNDAPPPVEMCETLPASPACCTAATESPPPTIDVAPREVAAA